MLKTGSFPVIHALLYINYAVEFLTGQIIAFESENVLKGTHVNAQCAIFQWIRKLYAINWFIIMVLVYGY